MYRLYRMVYIERRLMHERPVALNLVEG